ncbi:PLP-dependent transferase [Lophiostoma macrostomum CBS 122681]|uniref:PLP-dependent transferase n=1 Tax=Lophiostoma macrostomum CBS 122681 TaxID=1314788 RepID=A0A6A6TN78_9PLEO|nr:PLP-dependent transferase [Lophiostoma macrostomum CBS 122681]
MVILSKDPQSDPVSGSPTPGEDAAPQRSSRDATCNTRQQTLYNKKIERIRIKDYRMLRGITYLDHAGTPPPSATLVQKFTKTLQADLLPNSHSSATADPNLSYRKTEETRLKVLQLFNASPDHFEVVFVCNATAGIKLVTDAFAGIPEGFDYYYHRDSHTSIVGVRELATTAHCLVSDDETLEWINNGFQLDEKRQEIRTTLFAYPAQSNMNGRRLSLSWPSSLRRNPAHSNTYSLLDASAYVSTSTLDLSDPSYAPHFTVLSFYKIFGFPNLGALVVRKDAAHIFNNRRYFGGGTTDMITCEGEKPWVARKKGRLCERLEDGTSPTHSIVALGIAIDTHHELFGGMESVAKHTGWLARCLYEKLAALRHANGRPVCEIYKDPKSTYGDTKTQGATIAFNIRKADGSWVGSSQVGEDALKRKIYIRTGSVCNPAGTAHALGLSTDDLEELYLNGFKCGEDSDIKYGPLGIVRVSFGAVSTLKNVDEVMAFMIACYYCELTIFVRQVSGVWLDMEWSHTYVFLSREKKVEYIRLLSLL